MTAFIWQTLALLGIAYLAGCLLGCTLRRLVGASAKIASPQPETVPPRRGEFVTPTLPPAPRAPVPIPPTVVAPRAPPIPQRDAFRRANTLEPTPATPKAPPSPQATALAAPPSVEAAAARFGRALAGTQPNPSAPAQQSPSTQGAGVIIGAAAVAAATAAVRVTTPQPAAQQPTGRPPAVSAPAPAVAPVDAVKPDDLKRIRAIDAPVEAALLRLGVRRFADIAAWAPGDVARVSRQLGFNGRVEQENWIEQAQILARGGETHYSQRLARGDVPTTRPTASETGQRAPGAASVPPPMPLTDATRARANSDIAAAAAATVDRAAVPPAMPTPAAPAARPAPTQVVEGTPAAPNVSDRAAFVAERRSPSAPPPPQAQAQPPATAARPAPPTTQQASPPPLPAMRPAPPAVAGVSQPSASPVATPPSRPTAIPGPVTTASSSAIAAAAAAGAAAATGGATMQRSPMPPRAAERPQQPPQTSASRPATGSGRDSLQRIGGINAEVERTLNAQGVTRYAQIATWSGADLERYDRLLGQRGRIQRESWVEQAQLLSKGDDTAYSRAQDQRARIVHEATSRPAAASAATPPRSPALDDLKRIRGVGVLIEKKLNSMGITRYDQIAGWSVADIDRASEALDFRGRIERENWVEQARILAAGGQTEFSRRVDRGDPV